MKAIVFDEYGGPEVLHEAERELPNPGPKQVRIKVHAVGVNAWDFKVRSGTMQGIPAKFPSVPGLEAAGVVDAVGDEVTAVQVGDEVFGWTRGGGGYAEYAVLATFAPQPAGVSFVDAMALPVAGETALRVLGLLGVKFGETLLVHGAGGAVGTMAAQLAVALGARVIGTAGASNQEYVQSLGAIPTVYGEGLVERVKALAPDGVDAVFDVSGHGVLPASIELRGGSSERIVTIADAQNAVKLGVTFTGGPGASIASPELLTDLADRLVRGELKVEIAGTYPLAEAAEAQRFNEAGHARGKLVLTVG